MINHARTLLANLPAGSLTDSREKYIPPDFRPLATLPAELRAVRQALFGETPDRLFTLYRVRQLLNVVYCSPFASYLTAFDPRLADVDQGIDNTTFVLQNTVTQIDGPAAPTPQWRGQPTSPDDTGILRRVFEVSVVDDHPEVQPIAPLFQKLVIGSGQDPRLPPTGYSLFLSNPQDGQVWNVEVMLKPTFSLGTLLQRLENLGEAVMTSVLVTGTGEPSVTFRNLWLRGSDVTYRLTGAILGLIWSMEEARRRRDANS